LIEAADNAPTVEALNALDLEARSSLTGEALQRVLEINALCRAHINMQGNSVTKPSGHANGLFDQ
jgi:hypothetical protein